MRRASASPAAWARASRAMRSSVALVATTASVVLRPFPTAPNGAPPRAKCVSASANVPSAARAPADRPFDDVGRGGRAGAVGVVRRRPAVRLAPGRQVEVEDHRGWYDRHDAGGPHRQAAPALLEPAHHAIRGAESEGGAAGEQNGVDA